MTLYGYDISAQQRTLDPAAVPGDFVIIKATGGDGYLNPDWRNQFAAARAAGKLVGIYHFARDGYTNATAASEASWFIQNTLDVLDGTVVVVLDWEGDNATDVAYAKAWLDQVTAETGVKPILYISYATINAANWAPVANADYGVWEAAYVLGYQRINGYNPPDGLAAIPYWNTRVEWQFTSSGYLPGWSEALDLDVFYGDRTTWAAYAAKNGTIHPDIAPTEDDLTPDQATQLAYIASPQFKIDLWTAQAGPEADARNAFVDSILKHPVARAAADGTVPDPAHPSTSIAENIGWSDSNGMNNTQKVLDAVAKVNVTLTDAQVQALADKLNASLPAANLALLKSKL